MIKQIASLRIVCFSRMLIIVMGIALMLITACATIPGYIMTKLDIDKGDPFLIYKQNNVLNMGANSHIKTLVQLNTNRLVLSYQAGGESIMIPAVIPWPAYSDDRGKTWQFGNPLNLVTNREIKRKPWVVEMGEKPVKGFYGLYFSPARFSNSERVMYEYSTSMPHHYLVSIRSEDDGLTWQDPETITVPIPEEIKFPVRYICFASPAVVTSNDQMYTVVGLLDHAKVKLITVLYRSDDRGRTLLPVSIVAEPKHSNFGPMPHGPGEPAMLALSDTEFIVIMRTGGRAGTAGISVNAEAEDMLIARSTDAGKTWKRKRMSIQGVMPRLLKMSNGVLVLGAGRPGNRIYFSVDGGESWGGTIELSNSYMYMTSGYLDMVEVEPGKLLVVYDSINAPLDWRWKEDEDSLLKKTGNLLSDIIIGPGESTDHYNQIIGRYITVTPR